MEIGQQKRAVGPETDRRGGSIRGYVEIQRNGRQRDFLAHRKLVERYPNELLRLLAEDQQRVGARTQAHGDGTRGDAEPPTHP